MRRFQRYAAAAICLAATGVTPAMAADLGGSIKDTPHETYVPDNWRGWMIRARVLGVLPDTDTSNFSVAGADVDIDNSVVPELDFTYFFNRNIAIEAIAAVTPHNVEGRGTIAGAGKVGDAWLLPPTVLLQYHFHMDHGIKPYVGAGVNYTFFFNEDSGPNFTGFDLKDGFGLALQAGVDIHLRDHWYLNIDVKKIWLDTDAKVNGGAVTAEVDIDPLIVGVGLGYKF